MKKKLPVVTGITLALAASGLFSPALAQGIPTSIQLPEHLKTSQSSKASGALQSLHKLYKAHLNRAAQARAAGEPTPAFKPKNLPVRVRNSRVLIDAVAKNDPALLKAELEQRGLTHGRIFGAYVSGWLPLSALPALETVSGLQFAHASYAITHAGSVQSEGDSAMKANIARTEFYNVDGRGLNVGVLSDSYDCLVGAAADIASGDLPNNVNLLAEMAPCTDAIDEGRAMLQIVHDVAPGAGLAFHTAFNGGMAGFAQGILDLANPAQGNAKVIVDDVIYLGEPMFQDGIVAQAVDQVKAAGVAYFSSAGNNARKSYESAFQAGSNISIYDGVTTKLCRMHNFANTGDTGTFGPHLQSITIPAGGTLRSALQWDSPFFSMSGAPGSSNNVDFYLLDSTPAIVWGSNSNNVGGDPVEILSYTNSSGSTQSLYLMICNFAGPNPGKIKYVSFGNETIVNYNTNSATSYGHANAAGAEAVGAARYSQTPVYGQNPPLKESFSSAGGVPILFDTAGNAITPVIRAKPEIVAPDGGLTTFFYGPSHRFYGTSAAAPHAAGVAALILNLNPALGPDPIYSALESTTIDMATAGFDYNTGFGLIQANRAVEAAATLTTIGNLVSGGVIRGDVTRDGQIDSTDINLILAGRGPAAGPKDARDYDGDLDIDNADARLATQNCTKPRCAP
jgi:hypothetical protein